MSKLLIVESPTKARTIGRMLGKGYEIHASMGHVRDLPEHAFGIDIENNFTPEYVDTPRSKSIIKGLRAAAKQADEIYLAPDPDREGEAIAWHLKSVLSGYKVPFYRVTFHEITHSAIEHALNNKGEINQNLVDAQQARRVLDRIVGYQVSPLLWRKLEKGSSAGRVQSAALRLIVERERLILAFVKEEYWNFSSVFFSENAGEFGAKLFKIDGKDFKVKSKSEADLLMEMVKKGGNPKVTSVSKQKKNRYAPPPFTTSTLQQTANQQLHFTATSTMRYAQQLYEGVDIGQGSVGLITYMRTDSVTIASEAQVAAVDFIRHNYGAQFAPPVFNRYKNKAAAQEAHEAIRPTDVNRTPEQLSDFLEPAQLKLYTLIWKRFVASQMSCAQQELTTVDVEVHGGDNRRYDFRANVTVTLFPGFLQLLKDETKDKIDKNVEVFGKLQSGEMVQLRKLASEQKFTDPPPRFTEATLIKELEENGIGRPSTYATILRTIQDRGYVSREQGKLLPTEAGFSVNDFLVERLPELFNIGFTAQMEQQLDDVEAGKIGWVKMMKDFYSNFQPWIEAARNQGAPPPERAELLLSLFDGIKFIAPQKVGRRTFDDGKFITSIKEKFSEEKKLTEKQYQALINLVSRYYDQIPSNKISKLSDSDKEALSVAAVEQRNKNIQREHDAALAATMDYSSMFAAFDNVKFPPARSGKNMFDEGKFFTSLKKQALSGKPLTVKQLSALSKLANKYRSELNNPEVLFAIIGDNVSDNKCVSSCEGGNVINDEVKLILSRLSKVIEWAEPIKRGRFSFDDKKFYESLSRQFYDGRLLSEKQLIALRKLDAKYAEKN